MIDKQTKRKLKRIWCERLVIGLCVPVALVFSIVKGQSVYHTVNQTRKAKQIQQTLQQTPKGQQMYQETLEQVFQQTKPAQQLNQQTKVTYRAQLVQQANQECLYAYRQTYQPREPAQQVSPQKYQTYQQKYQAYQQALQVFQQVYIQAQWQKLQQESLFLAISALCFIMLILLLRQRNRISLTLTGQLICFFPEECIAELEALNQQMKSEQRSVWLIRMIMLQNFLELFLAFYVQINIENLWLPKTNGHRKTDE